MKTREEGVSLVDVCIAAAITVIICGVAYPGFLVANDTLAVSGEQVRLEGAAERIQKALLSEVRTGKVAAVSAPGGAPWIEVHPLNTGIDLEKLDADGTVPWDKDTTHRLAFRETGSLTEKDAKTDLNHDGDLDDEFALGLIELTTPDGTRPITQRGRVILGRPNYREDLDGDGTEDPLFAIDGRKITLRLYLVRRDRKGHYHQTNLAHSVYLRNVQE